MCKILLIREHHVNVLPERVYLNGNTEGFQSQIQKVRVTKLTHSPWNCPKTAPGVQGRQELPLPSRVSVARPVLSSKCLLCRLPLQIHITCIACDVISFNGQEQLCCQTFAWGRDLSMIQLRPSKKAKNAV